MSKNIARERAQSSKPSQKTPATSPEERVWEVPTPPEYIQELHNRAALAVPDLGQELAYHSVSVCFVPDNYGPYCPFRDVPIGGVYEMFWKERQPQEIKGRNGLILGDLHVGRTDNSVTAIYLLGYDVDHTLSLAEVVKRVEAYGAAALIYTTHSHGRTRQKLAEKDLARVRAHIGNDKATHLTDEQAQAYCASRNKLKILKGVRVALGVLQDADTSPHFVIEHDAQEKMRILVVLATPIVLAEVKQDGFRLIYDCEGAKLFGDVNVFDKACKNPSHIHWNPANPIGSTVEHVLKVQRGPLLDWRPTWDSLQTKLLEDRARAEARAEAWKRRDHAGNTSEIGECLKHIPAAECNYSDWFKALAAIHHETNGSDEGLALAHDWSELDDRYDANEVERLWGDFDSSADNGKRKCTMGTLVKLARERCPDFRLSKNRALAPKYLKADKSQLVAPILAPGWRKHLTKRNGV